MGNYVPKQIYLEPSPRLKERTFVIRFYLESFLKGKPSIEVLYLDRVMNP